MSTDLLIWNNPRNFQSDIIPLPNERLPVIESVFTGFHSRSVKHFDNEVFSNISQNLRPRCTFCLLRVMHIYFEICGFRGTVEWSVQRILQICTNNVTLTVSLGQKEHLLFNVEQVQNTQSYWKSPCRITSNCLSDIWLSTRQSISRWVLSCFTNSNENK